MTPEAALYDFLSDFGIPAYASSSVPDEGSEEWRGFPYLTYDLVLSGGWDAGEVSMAVNLWYRTASEAIPNAKVRQIAESIGMSGITVPCDGGILWIKRGSPWAQAMSDSSDTMVKRRYLNLDIEYIIPI